jgi:SAM-dependent methyltransferase
MTNIPALKDPPGRRRPAVTSAFGGDGPHVLHEFGEGPETSPAESNGDIRREIARNLGRWRARNRFYHRRIAEYLRFVIPTGQSVLLLGCEDGALLSKLRPSWGVGVDSCYEMIAQARKRHPQHEYFLDQDYAAQTDRKFDYVVLNDITGEVHDLFTLLQRIAAQCKPDARVVIVQHNYLWRPMLRLAARLKAKRPDATRNWLSVGDLRVFLEGVGFETIDVRPKLFCPVRLLGLGPLINWMAGLVPLVNRLACTEIIVARPAPGTVDPASKTATIVLTVRDERDNIEPMVRAIPRVGAATEILFVEGHSTDGTQAEVERVIEAYPEKNIRLLTQGGVGQGDAIRKGFAHADGDVIILLEADQTSPAEDVLKAFEVVATGRADYVNGSRFIYPRAKGAMPRRNALGNWFFAVWFTWFLGQRTSDVLCGLKAIARAQFLRLNRNWGFLGLFDPFGDFELLFGASRLGLKICEVPTRYHPRTYGAPKSKLVSHGLMLLRMAARATRIYKCR